MPIYGIRATAEAKKLLRGDPLAKLSFKRVILLTQLPTEDWLTFDEIKAKIQALPEGTGEVTEALLKDHNYISEVFYLSRKSLLELAYYKASDGTLYPHKPIGLQFREPRKHS